MEWDFLNVISAVTYLVVSVVLLFLALPVGSMAGNDKGMGWPLAFLGLLAFLLIWLFSGFGLARDVFGGAIFHAEYWSSVMRFEFSAVGFRRLGDSFLSWLIHVSVAAYVALQVFSSMDAVDSSKGMKKILAWAWMAALLIFGYLWVSDGRQWILSVLA